MLYKYGQQTSDFLRHFYFYFSVVFYIVLVGYEMIIGYSYPTHPHGIIVTYICKNRFKQTILFARLILLPLGERCRPRPPRPPLIPPRPPLPPLTGDMFPGVPPELNLLVGDLAGFGLTAVGEAASGDVGDLSDTASLLEFSVAPSAPSRFKGTHF